VKWHCTFNGVMSSAALLVPLMTAADSRLQTGAPGTALSASAHVDFKIVIPHVLYIETRDAHTLSVMTNSRNATLSAEIHAPDSSGPVHGNMILSASGHRVIAQDSLCAPAPAAAPADKSVGNRQVICTASMP
jgi:hypothetical protein